MTKQATTSDAGWILAFVALGLVDLAIIQALLLRGTDVALFHPKGLIAHAQFNLIMLSMAVLLAIALPSLFFFYFFAWRYRETNTTAVYQPGAKPGKLLVFSIWAIPSFVMLVMAVIMWNATHQLDPHTPIASTTRTLSIQVIALRWKWLFIYPAQHIASVNYVQIPTGTPVKFELTADEVPMSSFWIPHLGGQLYAMTGHVNNLNLMADTPGDYPGSSAEINGPGFAGMKFIARADSQESFDQWVGMAQQTPLKLDTPGYAKLLLPSQNNQPQTYSSPQASLYDTVVMKYTGGHNPDPAMTNMEHQ